MRSHPARLAPLAVLASLAACKPASEDLPAPVLVPAPAWMEDGVGSFTLDEDTVLYAYADERDTAELLAAALRPATGLPLPIEAAEGEGGIALVLDPGSDFPAEGYLLEVLETGVTITAGDTAGLFYGTQTLRQMLPAEALGTDAVDREWRVPVVHIEDAPRFGWRGAMIDVARHFFEIEAIERQIDLLALHKINRLHLHLTDDQGWRIEITSWPELTEVGGRTEVGRGRGGWYTQAEFADLVAYAAERHVTIVPEIDFPGHANAALSSYAELNASGVAEEPYTGTGVISTPLWLDGEITWTFVADVWREMAALTPGPWLHVGGDEAIDHTADEYAAFVVYLQELVAAEGKTMVGWDEIGPVPLEAPYLTQYWFDEGNARAAVANGGQLIVSPAEHAYLDMRYNTSSDFGQIWASYVDVQAAYDWEPVPEGLDEALVVGVEGAMWTEYVDDEAKLDFMLWPRLAAHAEVGWTQADLRDWDDFRGRLGRHGARLNVLGVGFYASPEIDWSRR